MATRSPTAGTSATAARGGGARLAHQYPTAGVRIVTLTVADGKGGVTMVRLSKTGYADQTVTIDPPAGAPDAIFKAGMLRREAARDFDAAAGGTVIGKDGATATFAANALVDATGRAVTGTAQIAITPIDIRGAGVALSPGGFAT